MSISTPTPTYAAPIRIFHSIFALAILAQLAVGELMDVPEVEGKHELSSSLITAAVAHEGAHHVVGSLPAGPVEESLGFEVHEILGLTIAGLIVIRLLLAMTQLPGANWRSLFPWIFAEGRERLVAEFKAQSKGWLSLKVASPDESRTIARSAHGLMILGAAIMGATGAVLFLGWSTTAPQTTIIELVAGLHETVVGGLELLIAVHVLAVVLHYMQGHPILERIKPGK